MSPFNFGLTVLERDFVVYGRCFPRSCQRLQSPHHFANVPGWSCLLCRYCQIELSTDVQERVSPTRTRRPVSQVQLPEHITSAPLPLLMVSLSYCTPITAPRSCSLGWMGCWMRMRGISRNMASLFSGPFSLRNSLIAVRTWLIFPRNQKKRTLH